MKFASYHYGSPNGRLVIVSTNGKCAVPTADMAVSVQDALERWAMVEGPLKKRAATLNLGQLDEAEKFDPSKCCTPLPSSPQWCGASTFLNHGKLIERAFNTQPIPEFDSVPMLFQGASDDFLGGLEDVTLPSEADDIDFKGEFSVITEPFPMRCSEKEATNCIRSAVQLND